ncbi:hypothetical protein NFI96_005738 [Prochilodus magdalenae]|nr:hypothetical protein NFI96_005738 [Prochilodus magdalenae]
MGIRSLRPKHAACETGPAVVNNCSVCGGLGWRGGWRAGAEKRMEGWDGEEDGELGRRGGWRAGAERRMESWGGEEDGELGRRGGWRAGAEGRMESWGGEEDGEEDEETRSHEEYPPGPGLSLSAGTVPCFLPPSAAYKHLALATPAWDQKRWLLSGSHLKPAQNLVMEAKQAEADCLSAGERSTRICGMTEPGRLQQPKLKLCVTINSDQAWSRASPNLTDVLESSGGESERARRPGIVLLTHNSKLQAHHGVIITVEDIGEQTVVRRRSWLFRSIFNLYSEESHSCVHVLRPALPTWISRRSVQRDIHGIREQETTRVPLLTPPHQTQLLTWAPELFYCFHEFSCFKVPPLPTQVSTRPEAACIISIKEPCQQSGTLYLLWNVEEALLGSEAASLHLAQGVLDLGRALIRIRLNTPETPEQCVHEERARIPVDSYMKVMYGYVKVMYGYVRVMYGYVRVMYGYVKVMYGYMSVMYGYVRVMYGYVKVMYGYMKVMYGYVRVMYGYVRVMYGYVKVMYGYMKVMYGYVRVMYGYMKVMYGYVRVMYGYMKVMYGYVRVMYGYVRVMYGYMKVMYGYVRVMYGYMKIMYGYMSVMYGYMSVMYGYVRVMYGYVRVMYGYVRVMYGYVRVMYGYVRVMYGYVRVMYGYVRVMYGYVRVMYGYVRVMCGYMSVMYSYMSVMYGYVRVMYGYVRVMYGYVRVMYGYVRVMYGYVRVMYGYVRVMYGYMKVMYGYVRVMYGYVRVMYGYMKVMYGYMSVMYGYMSVMYGYVRVMYGYVRVMYGYVRVMYGYMKVMYGYVRVVYGYVSVMYGYMSVMYGYVRVMYGYVRVMYGYVRVMYGYVRVMYGYVRVIRSAVSLLLYHCPCIFTPLALLFAKLVTVAFLVVQMWVLHPEEHFSSSALGGLDSAVWARDGSGSADCSQQRAAVVTLSQGNYSPELQPPYLSTSEEGRRHPGEGISPSQGRPQLEHPHTVPADGAVGVEVEGHQVFWTCDDKPFISVLTTVPPHTGSLGVSTKTKAGLVTEDDPLPF